MNTNQKGAIGLSKVISDLYIKKLHVYLPMDDFSPVDVIAMNDTGKITRLQVKYRTPKSDVIVPRYDLQANTVVNGVKIPINKSIIDGWALYLADLDIVKYIPISAFINKTSMNIDASIDYGNLWS